MARLLSTILVALIALVSCGEDGASNPTSLDTDPTSSTPSLSTPPPASTTTPPSSSATGDASTTTTIPGTDGADVTSAPSTAPDVPADLLESIVSDAAARAGVAPAEVAVLRGEPVTWHDGSLGCAFPGETYTQAPVEGYWVQLAAADAEYDYRAAASGFFKLCDGTGIPSYPTS